MPQKAKKQMGKKREPRQPSLDRLVAALDLPAETPIQALAASVARVEELSLHLDQFTGGMSGLEQIRPAGDEKQQAEIDRQLEKDKADLQKLQNDALTQSVEAVDKFNDAMQEASNKLRDQFGSFASGLISAARTGHAGTYGRNFAFGQFDKITDNFAKSIYQPGMLSIPGQGTATDPTFLGTLLKGTIFAQDPKAQGDMATKDNTTATLDNTTALLALYSALGGDPGSLAISGSSSVSIPFFGSSSSSPVLNQVAAVAKSLGINMPGAASSPSSTSSIGGPLGQIMKAFGVGGGSNPTLSTGAGIFGPTSGGIAIIPGVTDSVGANSGPALSIDDLPMSMQMPASINSAFSLPAKIGSPSPGAVWTPFTGTNAAGNPSTAGDYISAGVGTSGALYGGYQGVVDLTKGGARNIAAGIGSIAGSAAALDPEPISKGILAGVALVSGIVGSLLGDPRAARAKQLTEEQIAQTYVAPNPLNVTQNAFGMMTTTDYRGQVESLSTRPSVSSVQALLGFDPYNTSHVLSSSQWQLTPGGMVAPVSQTGPSGNTTHVSLSVNALDSKSITDRSEDIASALSVALNGTHRVAGDIQRVTGTQP